MTNVFVLIRGCLLGAVAAWTLIVLGIAIHFQMSFVDSAPQLTYVALAIFIATVTLALFLVVLVAPCNKAIANILRTKWELIWLGALAVLWSALAGYTTTPAAKDNEVECWDEDEFGNVVQTGVDGYSDAVYQARYRVLQAFAFFNCILLMFLFLFILLLAFWHHKRGRYVIWTTPTTSVGWFDKPTGHGWGQARGKTLPPPISQRKSAKDYEKWDNEKEAGSGQKRGFKFDSAGVAADVKDKFRRSFRDRNHESDRDDMKEDLIQKPRPAAVTKKSSPLPVGEFGERQQSKPAVHRSNSTPLNKPKPKQYVVTVDANVNKPALAPIAAKMAEERKKTEQRGGGSGEGPSRQVSQRERADRERQHARRERNEAEDDQREGRAANRAGIGAVGVKRSGSTPAGIALADPGNGNGNGGRRRDGSAARPDVVQRSGSNAKPRATREESRERQQTTGAQKSNNPYRQQSSSKQTPGRRI